MVRAFYCNNIAVAEIKATSPQENFFEIMQFSCKMKLTPVNSIPLKAFCC